MRKLTIFLSLACAAVAACGCAGNAPPQPTAKEKYAAVKIKLVGTWERQSQLGPAGRQWQFNADGTLVMREFRLPTSTSATTQPASTSATPQPVAAAAPTMHHRQYDVDVPLYRQSAGTWAVEGDKFDKLVKTVRLSGGDTMRIVTRIDRLAATELVEVSSGLDGPVKLKYQRKKPASTQPRGAPGAIAPDAS